MAVIIEELQADLAAPPAPSAAPAPAHETPALDEQQLLQALALEAWAQRRLQAD
jgi:hypothetical protein